MKKYFSIFIALFVLATVSCDDKLVKFYPSFDQSFDLGTARDSDGEFAEEVTYHKEDIVGSVDDFEIPSTGVIEEVDIESVWLEVETLPSNLATKITLSASASTSDSSIKALLSNYEVTIPQGKSTIPLTALVKDGVDYLKGKLEALKSDHKNFPDDITLKVQGFSDGGKIALDIKLHIKIGLVYSDYIQIGK